MNTVIIEKDERKGKKPIVKCIECLKVIPNAKNNVNGYWLCALHENMILFSHVSNRIKSKRL